MQQQLQRQRAGTCLPKTGMAPFCGKQLLRPCCRIVRRAALSRRTHVRAGPVEFDENDLMQSPDRINWYEAKFGANDMPDWNIGAFVRSEVVAPGLKNVVVSCEISREKVPLRNAYKGVGQRASIRVNNGTEHRLFVASPPFDHAVLREPLFKLRGDICAYETKKVIEPISTMAELHLLVGQKEAPDVYDMGPDDRVETGPFQGNGLDLRSSTIAGIYRYPTVVIFAEGRGIAHARALIESTTNIPNLQLGMRKEVRLYYRVPNEASLCYKELYDSWEALGCKVVTTTRTLQDAFDDDDTLAYEPEMTGAVILTAGDEVAEAAARKVCKSAEITLVVSDGKDQATMQYLDSTPKSFQRWKKSA